MPGEPETRTMNELTQLVESELDDGGGATEGHRAVAVELADVQREDRGMPVPRNDSDSMDRGGRTTGKNDARHQQREGGATGVDRGSDRHRRGLQVGVRSGEPDLV